jgi:hypothetical protein
MPTWRVMSMNIVQRGRADLVGPLRAAVRREGEPTLAAVRAAWMSVDVSSTRGGTARPDRSTQLRARVAAATFVQITPTGIRIALRPSQVDPAYGRSLPWYLSAYGRPWRHPVFGRRTRRQDWQVQRGQPVFFGTITAHAPAFRAGIERAMEQVAREF